MKKKGNIFGLSTGNQYFGSVRIKPNKLVFTPVPELCMKDVATVTVTIMKAHKVPIALKIGSKTTNIPYTWWMGPKDLMAIYLRHRAK